MTFPAQGAKIQKENGLPSGAPVPLRAGAHPKPLKRVRPRRRTFLLFSPPSIGAEEISEVVDTLHSEWITSGPKVARFEREFAAVVDARAALAVNSCTAALHLALECLGLGPGDGVITTPMTFCSSVHVIEHVGARPILVDVDRETLNIDPQRVEATLKAAIRPAPHGVQGSPEPYMVQGAIRNLRCAIKAILPVHLYGHPCAMDALVGLAEKHGLAVIEDAAHAFPAKYRGRMIGSFSPSSVPRAACFSFYATKNLTTAEGGMLSGPAELVDKARLLSLHGMSRDAWKRYALAGSWFYEVVAAGFKYNMTDIAAAMGLQQLRKVSHFQARRREIVRRYQEAFASCEELQPPREAPDVEHAWHLYALRLNLDRLRISRDEFIEELRKSNIGASVHFIPIHIHPYYRSKYGYARDAFPVAYQEYQRLVSLPLYPRMTEDDVEDVIAAVLEIAYKFRKTRQFSHRAHSAAKPQPNTFTAEAQRSRRNYR